MLTKLYRSYVSQEIRDKIYEHCLGKLIYFKRNFHEIVKMKFYWLFCRLLPNTEKNYCYAFMGKYRLRGIPYPFVLEYDTKVIDCLYDEKLTMYYVIHSDKKLYFPVSYKKSEIVSIYKSLLAEQDTRSPHQYIKTISRMNGKILLDIGAAEGIFSLNVIDFVSHIYMFECDPKWINALEATFAPWKDKVEIVRKYVSDVDDESNITIDFFLEDRKIEKAHLFIKMDIEGYEQAALHGAKNTFNNTKDIDFSIATYHRKDDAEKIAQILKSYHQGYEFTDGFFYYMVKGNKGLRKAIIRKKP